MVQLALLLAAVAQTPPPAPAWSQEVALFGSDVQPVYFGYRIGVGAVSAELHLGTGRGSQYAGGLGIGVKAPLAGAWHLEVMGRVSLVQALTQGASGQGPNSLYLYETDLLSQLLFTARWGFIERWSLLLGPTLNDQVSFGPNAVLSGSYLPPLLLLGAGGPDGGGHQLWSGGQLGVVLEV